MRLLLSFEAIEKRRLLFILFSDTRNAIIFLASAHSKSF